MTQTSEVYIVLLTKRKTKNLSNLPFNCYEIQLTLLERTSKNYNNYLFLLIISLTKNKIPVFSIYSMSSIFIGMNPGKGCVNENKGE